MTKHNTIKTDNKQTARLNELKKLLSKLIAEDEQNQNDSDVLSSFHAKFFEENSSTLNAKLNIHNNSNGIMNSLLNMAKSPANNLTQIIKEYQIHLKEQPIIDDDDDDDDYDDDGSIYEDANTVTKTVYRSDSFDDPIDELFGSSYSTTNKTQSEESTNSLHGFYLEDFTDTFNLDEDNNVVACNDGEDGDRKENQNQVVKNDNTKINYKLLKHKEVNVTPNQLCSQLKFKSGDIQENKEIVKEDTTFFPSSSSSSSIPFNDVSMNDILDDLDVEIENMETSSQKSVEITNKENDDLLSGLNINEEKIAETVILKLHKQLQPTLLKLEKDSEKYEIMKNLYSLPSISNLNEVIREKYVNKGKKFNLEFHKDVINGLINEEVVQNRKRVHTTAPLLSADDQIRLNFNKFRALNTITEEHTFEISNNDIKENKILCQKLNYNKSKDFRKVSNLKTDELIAFLKLIKNGKIKDLNKVEHLVTLFETDNENKTINKLNSSELKARILRELGKRNVI